MAANKDNMISFRIEPEDMKKLLSFLKKENPKAQGMAHTKSSYARYLFYLGFEKEIKNWKEKDDGGNKK